jgi:hypothetical protein
MKFLAARIVSWRWFALQRQANIAFELRHQNSRGYARAVQEQGLAEDKWCDQPRWARDVIEDHFVRKDGYIFKM